MGRTGSVDPELVKQAVSKMKKHPTLTASEAMQLAGFSEEERKNRSTQRLIYRHLPGKSKRNLTAATSSNSSNNNVGLIVSCEEPTLCRLIQTANNLSTLTLKGYGFDGSVLEGTIEQTRRVTLVTEPNTEARRLLLSNATTHGDKFSKTGGYHLTSDDILIGAELGKRSKEKKRLSIEKTRRLRLMAIEEKARSINESKGGDDIKNLTVKDLDTLLAWHNVKKVGEMTKEHKFEKWRQIRESGKEPPTAEVWTDDDERALIEAGRTDLDIGDTAVGRLQKKRMDDLKRSAQQLTSEEWREIEKYKQPEERDNEGDNNSGII